MQKGLLKTVALVLLLVAVFSVFAVSPAFAASRQATAPASSKIAHSGTIVCYYRVTATAGLNARTNHYTTSPIAYTIPYGTIVAAYEDSTATGSGYTWRQLDDDNWSVTTWLVKTSARCVS